MKKQGSLHSGMGNLQEKIPLQVTDTTFQTQASTDETLISLSLHC